MKTQKANWAAEAVGWYGTVAILIAYASVSFGWLTSDNLIFQLLNFTGAIGIVIISLLKKAYPPATLNIIWSIIALVALIGMLMRL